MFYRSRDKDGVPVWVAVQCSFVETGQGKQQRKAGLGHRQPAQDIEMTLKLVNICSDVQDYAHVEKNKHSGSHLCQSW